MWTVGPEQQLLEFCVNVNNALTRQQFYSSCGIPRAFLPQEASMGSVQIPPDHAGHLEWMWTPEYWRQYLQQVAHFLELL